MGLLIAGILLWSAVHLSPAIVPGVRRTLVARLGLGPYKALFGVAIVAALVLIVRGWGPAAGPVLYAAPAWAWHVTPLFVLAAVILFAVSAGRSNLKRRIRHPQLTGVKLWAFGHLLANGELRSVLLFGGLLAWAVLEVILINRRDATWTPPAPVSRVADTLTVLAGVGVYIALLFLHPWLFGVSPLPG